MKTKISHHRHYRYVAIVLVCVVTLLAVPEARAIGDSHIYRASYTDADLEVSAQSDSGSPLVPGSTIQLSASVTNYGPAAANAAQLQVDLSSGLTYVSHTVTHGNFTPGTGTWDAGDLSTGVVATLTITATVNNPPAASVTFNPYSLSQDTNNNNNSSTVVLFVLPAVLNLASQGSYDGWVLESSETSNKGGIKDNRGKVFYVGDDARNRQYRGILSFDTSALPDNAIPAKVALKVKKAGLVGSNPFKSHKGLRVDIRTSKFGTRPTLQLSDFQARASQKLVGKFANAASSGWYNAELADTAYPYINAKGFTQFRLRFYKDDNNDFGADYFKFYSGNAPVASRPQLIVEYYIP